MPRLILASGSPRRRELLAAAGYQFDVVKPDEAAEQGVDDSCGPADYVAELAKRKAADVIERIVASCNKEHTVLLAADTIAECGGTILGKPRDEAHAREILSLLSGQQHRVYTGICVEEIGAPQAASAQIKVEATTLTMDPLSDDWLDNFLASGKWRGKAGAFGLQDGIGVVHITEGSETNVVGLPMDTVKAALAEFGIRPAAS